MMEFRAIQKLLFVILLAIFAFSVGAALLSGQSLFVALFWSFMNIIGADFPPNSTLVDPTNPLLLVASGLDIQGKLIITIILTTIFYQLLGGINWREKVVQNKIRKLSNHIVITPFDGIANEMVGSLQKRKIEFIVIEQNPKIARKMMARGILTINADPTQTEALEGAGIRRASHLMLLDEDDVKNTLIAIEAKRLNDKIKVVARIKRQEDIARMKRAGIASLILPEVAVGTEVAGFVIKQAGKSI
ncbi:MAG: NAD-binding protein [Candidatus Micrarchaeota archaeon]|nr:NAD-binding protein [Candidatus Micrarchaeota archaeon]MDE1804757.1 NAD-binding protein [Candidatus Micrarchaeota archaeon]MDE1847089.1 NAD-binding protein [Candidatus Micrarchaeota archaeon]